MSDRPFMIRFTRPNGNEFLISPAHVTAVERIERDEGWTIRIHTTGEQAFVHWIPRNEWPTDMDPLAEVAGMLGYDTKTPTINPDALPRLSGGRQERADA